jgi:hypothetical protein
LPISQSTYAPAGFCDEPRDYRTVQKKTPGTRLLRQAVPGDLKITNYFAP